MTEKKKRKYNSENRRNQSEETRKLILDAAFSLLQKKRYDGMTVQLVAEHAGVAVPTVYALFRSKAGILSELVERVTYGPEYLALVRKSERSETPKEKLHVAAAIACHIYEADGEIMNLLTGAALLRQELGELMESREQHRYAKQENVVLFLRNNKALKLGLSLKKARDVMWSLTSRELFTLFVRTRGWKVDEYEKWLRTQLVISLLGE